MRLTRPVLITLLHFGLGLAIACVSCARLLDAPEQRALDGMFVARYWIHGAEPSDPRIVILWVDPAAFKQIRKPWVFWQPELARLMQALTKAGAVGVGFDFVLDVEDEDLEAPARQALEKGTIALYNVVSACPVVMIRLAQAAFSSHGALLQTLYSAAERMDNLAAANLLTDADGTVRRLPIFSPGHPTSHEESFAIRLAELASGQRFHQVESGRWQLGAAPVDTEDDGTTLRINYPAPPRSDARDTWYSSIRFSDVWPRVKRGTPLNGFRGKVCLLSESGALSQDLATTPFASRYTPGVEVHAAALNTLLSGRYVRRPARWIWAIPTVAAALAAGMLASFCPLGVGLRAVFACGLLYGIVALEAFSRNGIWLPVVAPFGAGTIAFGVGYVERYLNVERGRMLLRRLFGRYVSPQVTQALLRDPQALDLGGKRRRVTVLFSDINNFTPTCERSTPEEVIAMLNDYFSEMIAIIDRHQGTVKQFVGDEIMVVYGAPQVQPDHAARAVRTALEMLERLDEMSKADPTGMGFYDVKIGIHTGDVVAGNIGSTERTEWSVVGDDVNLTARIESDCKNLTARLLVSEVTKKEAEPLMPDVEWVSRGPRAFKGKAHTMVLYEVRSNLGTVDCPQIAG